MSDDNAPASNNLSATMTRASQGEIASLKAKLQGISEIRDNLTEACCDLVSEPSRILGPMAEIHASGEEGRTLVSKALRKMSFGLQSHPEFFRHMREDLEQNTYASMIGSVLQSFAAEINRFHEQHGKDLSPANRQYLSNYSAREAMKWIIISPDHEYYGPEIQDLIIKQNGTAEALKVICSGIKADPNWRQMFNHEFAYEGEKRIAFVEFWTEAKDQTIKPALQ